MSQTNAKNQATLAISALSYGPYGIGRVGQRVWMVPRSAPGDTVVARLIEERERYSIGEIVRLLSPSPARRAPPCPYAAACGGCAWQHVDYQAQLRAKQQSVEDALRRIAKLTGYELKPIVPAAEEYRYRRRIRLQVGEQNRLGFYGQSSHELVEIASCLIADERLNRLIDPLRRWAHTMSAKLEHIEIVAGEEPGETVAIARADNDSEGDHARCRELIESAPGLSGLVLAGRKARSAWGNPYITIKLPHGLTLKVEADVFTQVNPEGNRRLIEEFLASAELQPGDRVLELFCGAGNFTLPMARRVAAVTAVEADRRAIANAKRNAGQNAIDNIRWICASVPAAVAQLRDRGDKFTRIVLDPPRAGAKGLARDLAALEAGRILYISCNPTTLARDLAALDAHGYKLRVVQPIDLFPQTFHVETLAVAEKQ
jgi:23S rRNA (uracil1939-C5)-methyltransferase